MDGVRILFIHDIIEDEALTLMKECGICSGCFLTLNLLCLWIDDI